MGGMRRGPTLMYAEQVRATQQLKTEQVGQTRSRTKAACTQATPSACTSSSSDSG